MSEKSTNDADKSDANVASHYDEENSAVDKVSTSDQEGGAVFEDTQSRLDPGTPPRKSISREDQLQDGAAPRIDDDEEEEYTQHLQQLEEERNLALQRNVQMQMRLEEFFRKTDVSEPEQLQDYEESLGILMDLKQQYVIKSEAARRRDEELGIQEQGELDKAENEWQAFLTRKRNVGLALLRRCLDKQAAEAKLEPILAAERLWHDELVKARLTNIKLEMKLAKLEKELWITEEKARNPVQVEFELLQVQKQKLKKTLENQNKEAAKLLRETSSNLELLSSIKEELDWSQRQLQMNQEQLADVEAVFIQKRDTLARIKEICNKLHKDILKLKESRGLMGNRILLQGFEEAVDAAEHLEERLENLRYCLAKINPCCDNQNLCRESSIQCEDETCVVGFAFFFFLLSLFICFS
ncbi:coiled-coil domain-containing protein 96 [Thalassophryne amazonica]|uniref:coiled-coil domain-containing protein 96 n=1 Tax=Thalassophryne amazonica TaxID=390379 RepID=UPI0014720270|nr:coiled-coil domain-containing protein 96 [Thalassophryne amazonica]